MKNKLKNIFEKEACPASDRLVLYVQDELSNADRHLVEKHVLSCEICADTVSGLESYAVNNSDLDQKLAQLKAKVSRASAGRTGSVDWRWAAAAVIVLLLGWSYFKLNDQQLVNENQIAELKEEEEKREAPKSQRKVKTPNAGVSEESVTDEKEGVDQQIKVREDNEPVPERTEEALELPVLEEELESEEALIAENRKQEEAENNTGQAVIKDKAMADDDEIASRDTEHQNDPASIAEAGYQPREESAGSGSAPAAVEMEREKEEIAESKELSAEKKAKKSDSRSRAAVEKMAVTGTAEMKQMEEAMDQYALKMYRSSASAFESIAENNPGNLKARLYAGLSRFNNKEEDVALSHFNKVLQEKESEYYETALWHKALILQNKGEREKALNLFREIKELKGDYMDAGNKALEELEQE